MISSLREHREVKGPKKLTRAAALTERRTKGGKLSSCGYASTTVPQDIALL